MADSLVQHQLFQKGNLGPLSASQTLGILENYVITLQACVWDGFRAVNDLGPEDVMTRFPAWTKGQMVTEQIWWHAETYFSGVEGVRVSRKLKFLKITIDDLVIVRFKRLDNSYLARSEDTDQAVTWFRNQHIDGIDDSLMRVTLGYRASDNWSIPLSCHLTHQSTFDTLAWRADLPDFADNDVLPLGSTQTKPEHGLPKVTLTPIISNAPELEEKKDQA